MGKKRMKNVEAILDAVLKNRVPNKTNLEFRVALYPIQPQLENKIFPRPPSSFRHIIIDYSLLFK